MSEIKQIHLRMSGGMGIPIEGSVDVDALSPDLARQVQKTLAPQKLARISRRPSAPYVTDQIAYEITLPDEQQEFATYTVLESQADDDLLDVLDELTAHIVEEKMRAKQAARETPEEHVTPSAAPPLIQDESFPSAGMAKPGAAEPEESDLGRDGDSPPPPGDI